MTTWSQAQRGFRVNIVAKKTQLSGDLSHRTGNEPSPENAGKLQRFEDDAGVRATSQTASQLASQYWDSAYAA
jgi:hypothetical protein